MSNLDAIPSASARVRIVLDRPAKTDGTYVLYWMTSARRAQWNFALQRAVEWGRALSKPLLVFEPLRCDYHWVSDRLHTFVIEGMADNALHFAKRGVAYFPYIEPERGADRGLLSALSASAAVVVTDDFPAFFLPGMLTAAARQLNTQVNARLEAVDSNGLLPLSNTDRVFHRAVDFRRYMQRELPAYIHEMPLADPLLRVKVPTMKVPREILRRWPAATPARLDNPAAAVRGLPIDHSVGPAAFRGGSAAAKKFLRRFLAQRLHEYPERGNHPDDDATSGLSPYLHFGHISAHEIVCTIAAEQEWSPTRLAGRPNGRREGWWGMTPAAEAFLDQLVTWRELGFNMCHLRRDYDRYSSLPDWARETLATHAKDKREIIYSLAEFAAAATHDPLWNAAQRQLVREGRLHNYLRMLWGKKILEWTASPEEALRIMLELNNRYAVDGRDPNSSSGIFWVLGRYDRPWFPERPIFGRVRYMSSANTQRKLRVKKYLERFAE